MNEEKSLKINLDGHVFWMPTIIGVALILSTMVGAYAFYTVRAFDNTLSVTGSARAAVTSDRVKWGGQVIRTVRVSNLQSGYVQIAKDKATVEAFLKEKGIEEKEVTVSAVLMEENYNYNSSGIEREKEYNLRQTFEVNSGEVEKITFVAKDIQALINKGVIFSTYTLEYSYSGLAELRVSLLGEAIVDAKARASAIATASGKKVGQLKSAASGVVQVLSPGSVEVADYGAYDTSKIEKEVMVTVKAAFTLR